MHRIYIAFKILIMDNAGGAQLKYHANKLILCYELINNRKKLSLILKESKKNKKNTVEGWWQCLDLKEVLIFYL